MKVDIILSKGFKTPALITVEFTYPPGITRRGTWKIIAGEHQFRLIATVKSGAFQHGFAFGQGVDTLVAYNDFAAHNPATARADPKAAFGLKPAPNSWTRNGYVAIINPMNTITKSLTAGDAEYHRW